MAEPPDAVAGGAGQSARVRIYVGGIAALAVGVAAVAELTAPRGIVAGDTRLSLVLSLLLLCLAEFFQLSVYHRDETITLNLIDGLLAPLVVIGGGLQVAVVVGLALLVSNVVRRNAVIKTVFNVSQWVLCATVGVLVMHSTADLSRAEIVGAVVFAIIAMDVLNNLVLSLLLLLANGSVRSLSAVSQGLVLCLGASLVTGVCLTAATLITPWTLLIGVVLIAGMHATGRAEAAVRADHRRLEALQRATHHLAGAMTPATAVPEFLEAVLTGFEVQVVELVLDLPGTAGRTAHERHGCRLVGGQPHHFSSTARHPVLDALPLAELTAPVRVDHRSAEPGVRKALQAVGRKRLLAAPLRSSGELVGALLLFDRSGVEGFEAGEVSVVAALAREFVGFLDRCRLTDAIDEERRKLADIIDSTSDGIFTLQADGTVTSWNLGFAAMTGYSADEMVGTRHFGLLRPRDAAGHDVHLERWLDSADDSASTELQVLTASGATAWLSCTYSRLPGGNDGGDTLVCVARNVTHVRELERLKDDFVAVVSHELRTPLVPIKGWAQTLLNRGDRMSDIQRRGAVQSILAQAQKLESLILNILEASRIEAGHAEIGDVIDLTAVTGHAVDDMLAARPERTIRFAPPHLPAQVRGSAVWAERAVANLVANAVKYSPDEEPVDVVVSVDARAGEVLVAVTDRGPGIPAEARERIFARFERLEETRQQTGTGLGLYITRRFARAMGGDVTVSSVPGAGSSFVLRLPLLAPAASGLPRQRHGLSRAPR